jgi:hypothetical protein
MILDPDYARVFTQMRIAAWQYGFSCSPHGSFTRDLDLILVPWTEDATDKKAEQVIRLVADACDLTVGAHGSDAWDQPMKFTVKPHGRRAISLHFPGKDRRWVDVSVVPCRRTEGETP